jgi:hypothetical protein
MRPRARAVVLAAVVAFGFVVLLWPGPAPEEDPLAPESGEATAADAVPYDGRSPREPAGEDVRVLVSLPRPALGDLDGAGALSAALQRRHVASLRGESRALRSGLEARGIRLRDVATYERTWNGFAATVRGTDLLRLTEAGLRAIPVRRFYPAISEPVPLAGRPPAPREPARRKPVAVLADGGPVAALLTAAGQPVTALPVPARRPEQYARTDELLAGLERAVDPDGDGSTEDRSAVALVTVNAPFAGFSTAPEARAAAAALRLGVPVVAPSGHEGSSWATIGSPGGAPDVVTVGALSAPEAVARLEISFGSEDARPAAALAGAPAARLQAGPVVTAQDAESLLRPGAPRLVGRLAIVRAASNPGAQAAAAEAAGARAVLIAEPRGGRVQPGISAGRVHVPVVGVTGEAARRALAAKPGEGVSFGRPSAPPASAGTSAATLSRFSSGGPAFGGAAKPDLAAVAWADVALDGRRLRIAGGAVAAARVALELAGGPAARTVGARAAGRRAPRRPVAADVGPLRLTRAGDRVTGVRFTLGAFERGDPPAGGPGVLNLVERLELVLVDRRNRRVRRLTPRGGAPDLLPGEYAYTLPRAALRSLRPGLHRFQARAWSPLFEDPTVVRSAPFVP